MLALAFSTYKFPSGTFALLPHFVLARSLSNVKFAFFLIRELPL
jgi:hypothetical protein